MYNAGAEVLRGGSKSPISMLQELMMKGMKQLPNYTLIHDGSGTHLPSFTIKVECDGKSVEATASSKKEAKHKAAQEMLNLLSKEVVTKISESMIPPNEIKSVNITTDETTLINSAFNSIGKLQELCAQNRISEPHYEITNISGPSHAPMFTITCTMQTLQEEACARSKKQAKQDVAQKMLNRLKANVNLPGMELISVFLNDKDVDDLSKGIELLNLSVTNLKESRKEQTDLAKARYADLTKKPGIVDCKNDAIPISMYHRCFKFGYLKVVESLTYLLNRQKSDNLTYAELRVYLKLSADILKCKIKEIGYKLKTANVYMVGIQLSFTPQIMEVGYSTTEKEAEKNAVIAVMDTLLLLLK